MKNWSKVLLIFVTLSVATCAKAQTWAESREALTQRDYPTAFAGFSALAQNGDQRANFYLAMMYSEGWGTERNKPMAMFWYRKAAEQNDWVSQYSLGEIYAFGAGVPLDMKRAYFWWLLASNDEIGRQKTQKHLELAKMQISPDERVAVQSEARRWRPKSASQAKAIADAAFSAFTTTPASGLPKVSSAKSVGEVASNDRPLDLPERERKAESGDTRSQLLLGLDFQNGKLGPVDQERAAYWFQKAAEGGNDVAQLMLGIQYSLGRGVPIDQQKAFQWYLKSAEQGIQGAQYEVALCYTAGKGVTRDDREAFGWFQKAADQGYSDAQVNMGLSYQLGRGVVKDSGQALVWFKKAAAQNHVMGQLSLGSLYALGDGVPKDEQLAASWYKKAAERGNAQAQLLLAVMYNRGTGVPKDDQRAYFWMLISAAGGNQNAIEGRDIYERSLTPEQRNGAQAAARDWKPVKSSHPGEQAGGSSASEEAISPTPGQGGLGSRTHADSTGSGFRVARGAIVTNHHVVNGCSRLSVNGVAAEVRGSDARSDLALLNSTVPGPSTSLRARRVAVGEPVAVAGYPLRGLLSGFNMTTGTLSSLSGMGGDTRLVQITAPVQPGNSGGPVLDSAGNLMGVVVSKLDAIKAAKITGDIPQNVNFAINANVLRSFLDANSVEYETANSDKAIASTAIAEKAKGFTVLVECWK